MVDSCYGFRWGVTAASLLVQHNLLVTFHKKSVLTCYCSLKTKVRTTEDIFKEQVKKMLFCGKDPTLNEIANLTVGSKTIKS